MAANLATIALVSVFIARFGLTNVLLIVLPVALLAAPLGVWMFYMQHQFDTVYWRDNADWDFHDAALHGSSFYDLPDWMKWATVDVSYHHVHHLQPRIPHYRLREAHEAV